MSRTQNHSSRVLQVYSSLNSLTSTVANINNIANDCGDQELKGLPKAFLEVAKKLIPTGQALVNVKPRLKHRPRDRETQADKDRYQELRQAFNDCKDKATRLESIFNHVLLNEEQTASERYRDIANPGETVERLMIEMLKYILEAANPPIVLLEENEVQQLQQSLEELSKLPPSLVENKSGHAITNYGPGTQNVHLGQGNQNINNSPSAPQLNGIFHGGMTFHGAPLAPESANNHGR